MSDPTVIDVRPTKTLVDRDTATVELDVDTCPDRLITVDPDIVQSTKIS